MADDVIERYSLEELAELRRRGETETRPDAPEVELDEAFWQNAKLVMPPTGKTSLHLRIDSDTVAWFRAQGRGWQTRMNAVLRAYVEAQRRKAG